MKKSVLGSSNKKSNASHPLATAGGIRPTFLLTSQTSLHEESHPIHVAIFCCLQNNLMAFMLQTWLAKAFKRQGYKTTSNACSSKASRFTISSSGNWPLLMQLLLFWREWRDGHSCLSSHPQHKTHGRHIIILSKFNCFRAQTCHSSSALVGWTLWKHIATMLNTLQQFQTHYAAMQQYSLENIAII